MLLKKVVALLQIPPLMKKVCYRFLFASLYLAFFIFSCSFSISIVSILGAIAIDMSSCIRSLHAYGMYTCMEISPVYYVLDYLLRNVDKEISILPE